ncbi:MAG: NADH-quinone oxidoreductase subunit NuoF [SAR324 cluster bacterium]|uniref:NADH-quinone oxidoreductase subunit NuoF n=1 Tax=SAR324 cluster bacterium TaxID=2024889 RepID=A0A7X9FP78_9DELT|nr:NADH-quinone oxidoreductase subunit NuoF [SAR324 cluster bacterium]
MNGLHEVKCCEQCWHSNEKPCPDFITCFSEGPLCHESEECRRMLQSRMSAARLEHVEKPRIFVGAGTCGLGAGAAKVLATIKEYLEEKKLDIDVVEVGCIGFCSLEPLVEIQMPGKTRLAFHSVTTENVIPIIEGVLSGSILKDLVLGQHSEQTLPEGVSEWADVAKLGDHPFFKMQTRWVLANCGIINPSSIDEYIARGGYKALSKVLKSKTPQEVCDMVELSGLRGRGGGGFPTGKKWKIALAQKSKQKYLICNADEGDPGAFMDRAVIEGDPHRLLEGIVIAAYAIGANKAYVYIRAEYPLAIDHLKQAIEQAKTYHLLGENILDSGIDVDIIIKKGAGAFVCGEETALINSIEGKRGMPRPRPPFPAINGLFGKPTIINNVETLANVAILALNGAEWFSSVGTQSSKGTKVFALSGKVARTGLVEVAMGTRIREIVFDIGGGIPDGKKYKAVQIGGPSGGCIPEQHLDIDVDYESLKTVGAMMGSGGLVVMDEDTCMVDVAKFFMDFIQRESCGKCIPCREGTRRMLEILERITQGRSKEEGHAALERFQGVMYLARLAESIRDTSLCGLGQTAPNPILSTLRFFRDEYEAHVFERRCPSGVCTELLHYSILEDMCRGCGLCKRKCPVGAIMGTAKSPHYIIDDKCIGCGSCMEVCRFDAVVRH